MTDISAIGLKSLMGRQIILKWGYLMIFMRFWWLLVSDGVKYRLRSKNGYAWSSLVLTAYTHTLQHTH